MTFQAHALEVLEFARLLDHVAGHAASALGGARIRALRPHAVGGTHLERDEALGRLRAEHQRVAAMRLLVTGEGGWRSESVPDLHDALTRLRVMGTVWTGRELRSAIVLLQSSRRTLAALGDDAKAPVARAVLSEYADALFAREAIERRLDQVLTEDGEIKDDASPPLRRIRREMRGAEGELVRLLERLMANLESHHRVDDASVTLRNGRYVIPVRREGRGSLGGIVHDSSHSGQTLFVEPPAAVEAGNRIRELDAEEMAECERILLELTETLRPEHAALCAALEALIALDALYGRARYALAAHCADAELVAAREGFHLREGRHPLLLAQGVSVVSFDLAMHPDERTLLVSGPNTGGKTVLLKALALCSLMVQSGIPAPVGPLSRVPCFDDIFADIGDEQSLEASLSTFSAHLKHLTAILEGASADALVLVDELGSGTDPLEGAALGGAILEELTRRGTTTVATTHLGALKELASEVPGVVNASLQFDADRLAPTYRLIKGIPGRSYGIAIARRLNMPAAVLVRAEERVPQMERDLSALLADVERRAEGLGTREREVASTQEHQQWQADRLAVREQTLREQERAFERESRKETRRYLLEARKEVERTIRDLKAAGASAIDARAVEARRGLEVRAANEQQALEQLDAADRDATLAAARGRADASEARSSSGRVVSTLLALVPGDAVAVGTLGGKAGKLLERRGVDAVVTVGSLKLTVPFDTLRRLSARHLRDERVEMVRIDAPEVDANPEVDLRGVRVHEIDELVVQALDGAFRADLAVLRIIHGKGTGALRERVTQMLKGDKRVKNFRLGAWNEGGAGVTVAEFT